MPRLLALVIAILTLCGGVRAEPVDPEGLDGKVMAGYQGWFTAEGDAAGLGWIHWGTGRDFGPGQCTVDLWPDVSEYEQTYPTDFRHADGSVARVFSSADPSTVDTHFRWMREYGIDGVFLQRFGSDLRDARLAEVRTGILDSVRTSAEAYGRIWAPMYDLSGLDGKGVRGLIEDWKMLVDTGRVRDGRHLTIGGRPLVAIWGLGFNDGRAYGPDDVRALATFLRDDPAYGGNAIMLGVPYHWRTLDGDAVRDEAMLQCIEDVADVVSPWTVGRYASPDDMDRHRERMTPDVAWCAERGKTYLPVIWPGFRWQNLQRANGNDPGPVLERRGGEFFWSQAVAARQAGATAAYIAMFDEVDEGTAIFKITNDPPTSETESFGTNEPAAGDVMLWLSGEINRRLFDLGVTPAFEMPERKVNQPAARKEAAG